MRVDQALACAIHYGLNPGMVIRFLMGEYVGKTIDSAAILAEVSPHINKEDCEYIKLIIDQGCPSHLHFKEEYENKHLALRKGNQHTFLLHPKVTAKAMNKEEKNSHVLPFKRWMVYFSPWCQVTPQGIREKNGKYRVIFDSSMQTSPNEVVLNHETSTDCKAVIDFGQAKTRLLNNIYNWCVSYPEEIIYLALADIIACFQFPRISADVTGAFRFIAKDLYFVLTSHVFGSNTLVSLWEPLRRAIQSMISVYSRRNDLVEKHQDLLDMLKWDNPTLHELLVKAYPCKVNQGILAGPELTANIYVDDILGAATFKENMARLLAAIIEVIFMACRRPNMAVCQCPLLLEKWHELIVGPKQIVLGLVVDTSKMTVGITDEYLDQVQLLLSQWDRNWRFLKCTTCKNLLGN
jgi:hypothetical protein